MEYPSQQSPCRPTRKQRRQALKIRRAIQSRKSNMWEILKSINIFFLLFLGLSSWAIICYVHYSRNPNRDRSCCAFGYYGKSALKQAATTYDDSTDDDVFGNLSGWLSWTILSIIVLAIQALRRYAPNCMRKGGHSYALTRYQGNQAADLMKSASGASFKSTLSLISTDTIDTGRGDVEEEGQKLSSLLGRGSIQTIRYGSSYDDVAHKLMIEMLKRNEAKTEVDMETVAKPAADTADENEDANGNEDNGKTELDEAVNEEGENSNEQVKFVTPKESTQIVELLKQIRNLEMRNERLEWLILRNQKEKLNNNEEDYPTEMDYDDMGDSGIYTMNIPSPDTEETKEATCQDTLEAHDQADYKYYHQAPPSNPQSVPQLGHSSDSMDSYYFKSAVIPEASEDGTSVDGTEGAGGDFSASPLNAGYKALNFLAHRIWEKYFEMRNMAYRRRAFKAITKALNDQPEAPVELSVKQPEPESIVPEKESEKEPEKYEYTESNDVVIVPGSDRESVLNNLEYVLSTEEMQCM